MKLDEFYNLFDVRCEDGEIKKAKVSDLIGSDLLLVESCSVVRNDGTVEEGFEILSYGSVCEQESEENWIATNETEEVDLDSANEVINILRNENYSSF